MSEPKTQTLMVIETAVGGQAFAMLKRKAIPWCTTHDSEVPKHRDWICWSAFARNPHLQGCVISTGGLLHKWWTDKLDHQWWKDL